MQELSTKRIKEYYHLDLEAQTIKTPSGTVIAFDIEPSKGKLEKLLKRLGSCGFDAEI